MSEHQEQSPNYEEVWETNSKPNERQPQFIFSNQTIHAGL